MFVLSPTHAVAQRWEKHSWRRENGKEVENAELIKPLAALIDKRDVGFRKIKGHSCDPWNDLVDSLAVKERNQQLREVVIQLIFRAVINKKEKVVGFDRVSIQALADIHDSWPRLVAKCGDVIGVSEDYEILHDKCKLARPLIESEQYEIISRMTLGFVTPTELRAQLRSSIDSGRKEGRRSSQACPSLRPCLQVARLATGHTWRSLQEDPSKKQRITFRRTCVPA
jgi:hypothetical protein